MRDFKQAIAAARRDFEKVRDQYRGLAEELRRIEERLPRLRERASALEKEIAEARRATAHALGAGNQDVPTDALDRMKKLEAQHADIVTMLKIGSAELENLRREVDGAADRMRSAANRAARLLLDRELAVLNGLLRDRRLVEARARAEAAAVLSRGRLVLSLEHDIPLDERIYEKAVAEMLELLGGDLANAVPRL